MNNMHMNNMNSYTNNNSQNHYNNQGNNNNTVTSMKPAMNNLGKNKSF